MSIFQTSETTPVDQDNKRIIEKQINKQLQRKEFYTELSAQLEQTGATQISLSDPELSEANHEYLNDSKAMGDMLVSATTILNSTDFTALYDKDFHTGSEIKIGIELEINIMVAIPEIAMTKKELNELVVLSICSGVSSI